MERENGVIKKYRKTAQEIFAIQKTLGTLTDEQLKAQFEFLRAGFSDGKISEKQLEKQVFAVVCEASKRTLGKTPYEVQVVGALCLNSGDVASMATGEGKTLTGTMPAVLNVLTQGKTHVITANPYLAERDAEEMGKIYEFLGLSVGLVKRGQSIEAKNKAYGSDIIYSTASEIGFDYLRDHITNDRAELCGQKFGYAIIDEVDSVLIDEASMPLVLSVKDYVNSNQIKLADNFAKSLSEKDIEFDVEDNHASLSSWGQIKFEVAFGGFSEDEQLSMIHFVNNALTANFTLENGRDYIVSDGKIILVDAHSGRTLPGRQLKNYLHQALEVKEGVSVTTPTKTVAQISIQQLFAKFKKISGMTGTVQNVEDEFLEFYNMGTQVIPTNRPNARIDEGKTLFVNRNALLQELLREARIAQSTGQPLLIGTTTVAESEQVHEFLRRAGIETNVLNANTKHEAEIIADAGRRGSITISTNIAGRGTDIKLGGDPVKITLERLAKDGMVLNDAEKDIVFAQNFNSSDKRLILARNVVDRTRVECRREKTNISDLGGLRVIGTSLSATDRVEKQLVGRSGRQGDPGSSRILISLDDPTIERFASKELETKFKTKLGKIKISKTGVVQDKNLIDLVNLSSKRSEAMARNARIHSCRTDQVVSVMRDYIYNDREHILASEDMSERVGNFVCDVIKYNAEHMDRETFNEFALETFGADVSKLSQIDNRAVETISKHVLEKRAEYIMDMFEHDDMANSLSKYLSFEKGLVLNSLDEVWVNFLNEYDFKVQGSMLQSFSSEDPYRDLLLSASCELESSIVASKTHIIEEVIKRTQKEKVLVAEDESESIL